MPDVSSHPELQDLVGESSLAEYSELSLMSLLASTAEHWKMIVRNVVIAGVIAVIGTLLMHNTYRATARIMPPRLQPSFAIPLLGEKSSLSQLAGGSSVSFNDPNEIYVSMLKSDSISWAIIQKFDLMKVYKSKYAMAALRALDKHRNVEISTGSLIEISILDEDPKRAADIANAHAAELGATLQRQAIEQGRQQREFFAKQVAGTREDLAKAQANLQQVQEKSGVINPEISVKASVDLATNLKGQIAAREVQLRALQLYATNRNPEIIKAEQEIAEMKQHLAQVEKTGNFSGGKLTAASTSLLNAYRDVKFQEEVLELLTKEYEGAALDATNSVPVVQVLDYAQPPDLKDSPKRSLICLIAVAAVFVLSVGFVFLKAAHRYAYANPDYARNFDRMAHSLNLSRSRMIFDRASK